MTWQLMALSLVNARRSIFFGNRRIFLNILSYNSSQSVSIKMENGINVPTAGVIVIGNEILNGEVQDTNSHFIASKLYKLGIKLCKISVVPDNLEIIANEVSTFSNCYTHVITTGGIGPTHDDITFESVAAAFKEEVKPNQKIVKLIQDWYKVDDTSSPAMKMSRIPESAKLHFGENKEKGLKSKYPIVSVKNIFMFPGIPRLLRSSFDMLARELFQYPGSGFSYGSIYLTEGEIILAPILDETVQKFPQVTIGSYPELFNSYYKTKITMDSLSSKAVEEAKSFILSKVNKESIVNFNADTISQPWVHIESLCRTSSELKIKIEEAKTVLSNCINEYDMNEICLCYNGGKDCLVVLHLFHALMREKFPSKKIQSVYIPEENAFPQLEEFIQQSINRYDLTCETISGPMKTGLIELLGKRPFIKAVVMGTRRDDPHSDKLTHFSPTDAGWPAMMRVNPIINWQYCDVWMFLRMLCLPYCQLYDKGYTSIGGQDNTIPNPYLKCIDSNGRTSHMPAYLLVDAQHERKGRLDS